MTRTLISTLAIAASFGAGHAFAETHTDMSYCEAAFFPGDENQDERLSEDELEAMADAEFDNLDANADGSIDRTEYQNCVTAMHEGLNLTAETEQDRTDLDTEVADESATIPEGEGLGRTWNLLDSDNDGIVTNAEFVDLADAMYDELPPQGETDTALREPFVHLGVGGADDEAADLSEMSMEEYAARSAYTFWMTDTDADREITRQEWEARTEPHEVDIDRVNQRFEAMDTDAGGTITPEEYRAALAAAAQRAIQMEEAAAAEGAPVLLFFFERM